MQYPQEKPVLESIFKRFWTFIPATLLQKDPNIGVFPVSIAELLILPIFKHICKRLPLNFFNGSLLHEPKGLRYRLHDGVRLQGPSHGSSFCF